MWLVATYSFGETLLTVSEAAVLLVWRQDQGARGRGMNLHRRFLTVG
jgi:hypothetical protein